MPNISIDIKDKTAVAQGTPLITCGNSDYIIDFTFDSEWDEATDKTARFSFVRKGQQLHIDVYFTGAQVAVPVLSDIVLVEVGVYAGNLRTTTSARIPCRRSILCQGGMPADPEPDVYAQIMQELSENYPLEAGRAANEAANIAREVTDAAIQDLNEIKDELAAGGYIESIKDQNGGGYFKVWTGTRAKYNALPKIIPGCLYLIEDDMTKEEIFAALAALRTDVDNINSVLGDGTILEGLENMMATHDVTTAGTDLNDYRTSGIYHFPQECAPLNLPGLMSDGWLLVLANNSVKKSVKQIFYREGTSNTNDWQTFVRTDCGSGWSSWKKFATTDTVNALSSRVLALENKPTKEVLYQGSAAKGSEITANLTPFIFLIARIATDTGYCDIPLTRYYNQDQRIVYGGQARAKYSLINDLLADFEVALTDATGGGDSWSVAFSGKRESISVEVGPLIAIYGIV